MLIVDDFLRRLPFDVLTPQPQRVPFVFNSPHSGSAYPRDFLAASRLDAATIRRSEDTFVDELFADVVAAGAPLMRAHFPRAWLDVNREPYELDPKMFAGRLPAFVNARSVRVAGGLGTIARVVADGEDIYARPLSVEEGLARIEAIYKPYHATLRRLVTTTQARFGVAVLIDCHSMPSATRGHEARSRPDVIVGDRYGTSCSPELSDAAVSILTDLGLSVGRNRPYAGGFITESYGRPAQGVHALQIEINRGLYMDEARFERTAGFEDVAGSLATFARRLIAAQGDAFGTRIAAE